MVLAPVPRLLLTFTDDGLLRSALSLPTPVLVEVRGVALLLSDPGAVGLAGIVDPVRRFEFTLMFEPDAPDAESAMATSETTSIDRTICWPLRAACRMRTGSPTRNCSARINWPSRHTDDATGSTVTRLTTPFWSAISMIRMLPFWLTDRIVPVVVPIAAAAVSVRASVFSSGARPAALTVATAQSIDTAIMPIIQDCFITFLLFRSTLQGTPLSP